jgi:hypothetical protein
MNINTQTVEEISGTTVKAVVVGLETSKLNILANHSNNSRTDGQYYAIGGSECVGDLQVSIHHPYRKISIESQKSQLEWLLAGVQYELVISK